MQFGKRWLVLAAVSGGLITLTGCGTEPVYRTGDTISVASGENFDIKVGTVGPGEYASPPTIDQASTPRIQFLSSEFVGPNEPAGPRQLFHFKAVRAGKAVILIHHTGTNPTVVDTVDVH